MSKGMLFANETYSPTVSISPLTLAMTLVRSKTLTLTHFCIREMTMTLLAIWSATLISRTRSMHSALRKSKCSIALSLSRSVGALLVVGLLLWWNKNKILFSYTRVVSYQRPPPYIDRFLISSLLLEHTGLRA
jgi:hypothetical protein